MQKKTLKICCLTVFFVLVVIGAIQISEEQSDRQIIMSMTITPKISTLVQKKLISGNLYPIREIEVKSSISGILELYYVHVGDVVRNGDKILKIRVTPEPSQVETARRNLNTACITLESDKWNFDKDSILFVKSLISKADYYESRRIYLLSRAQFNSAKNQYHLLQDGYISESNISNIITATTSGTIIDLPLDEGMSVTERNTFGEGTTVALISQIDSFLFKGKVIENDVLALKKGDKITIRPTAHSLCSAEAVVKSISPKGHWDQNVMKYDIEAVFALADSIQIYSGFNATAEILIKEVKDVISIPEQCLEFEHDSMYVEILASGKFEKRQVECGISDGILVEVKKGISIKDKIKSKQLHN